MPSLLSLVTLMTPFSPGVGAPTPNPGGGGPADDEAWWFYEDDDTPSPDPDPTAPDLLAAIRDRVISLPVYADLTGDFRSDKAKRGGTTPYAIIREESSSPSMFTDGLDVHRVTLRLSVYDTTMDASNAIGKRVAEAVAGSSYRWVGGVSGVPVSQGGTNVREVVSAPGGSADLYSFTARFMVHTARPK